MRNIDKIKAEYNTLLNLPLTSENKAKAVSLLDELSSELVRPIPTNRLEEICVAEQEKRLIVIDRRMQKRPEIEQAIAILKESNRQLLEQINKVKNKVYHSKSTFPPMEWYETLDNCMKEYNAVVLAIEALQYHLYEPLPPKK